MAKSKRNASGSGNIREKVIKRKNGKVDTYWEARYSLGFDSHGKQVQKSISGKTQNEVRAKLIKVLSEIDAGTHIEPTKMTVGEWLTIWQRDYLCDVKKSSAYLYASTIKTYVLPELEKVMLKKLDGIKIQRLYDGLYRPKDGRDPVSAKTIKNIHGILHKSLQQAVELGYIAKNPTVSCKLPKIEKKEIQPLNEEQVAAFLKEVQGSPHEQLYKVALFTGLRQGELLGLTWDCIDWEHQTLRIYRQLRKEQRKGGEHYFSSPKNGKGRMLKLPASVIQLFKEQQAIDEQLKENAQSLWANRDLVFPNAIGDYLSHRTVYDCFKRIVKRIGVPDARFHDLRHTYAYMALSSNIDVKTVQHNLGHSTTDFTLKVYAHVTAQMQENAAESMERYIQSIGAEKGTNKGTTQN